MRIIAVLNRDGGTLRTMDLDAFSAGAVATFARHGHELECRVVAGSAVALWRDEEAGFVPLSYMVEDG